MKNKTLVPKLRFPEFRADANWQEKTLGNIASFYKGKGISKAETNPLGKRYCIRYGELYTKYSETINTIVSKTDLPDEVIFLSKKNDVIIPASGETKIDIATASCVMVDDVALGGDINVLRGKQNGVFLSYYLNSTKKIEISKVAQGDTVVHLYSNQLKLLKITIPDIKEQQKIADCLSSLDDLIAVQTQKLETLKTYKKGLMQQLFPAKGETVPKLRFEGFEGDWEEVGLESLSDNISSGRDKNDPNGEYDLYGSTGVIGKTLNDSYQGDFILVARVGANAGLLNKVSGKFGVTDNTLVISLKKQVNLNFIAYFLNKINLNNLVFGSGQPLITGGQLKSLILLLPCLAEQQKIAGCLSSVDDLINTQTQKIEDLKLHKKGLMQQLFPSSDEVVDE